MTKPKAVATQQSKHSGELPIKDIIRRLKRAGFPERFVRQYALPAWWDDELSANPATMAVAEVYLTRLLRVPIEALRNPDQPLIPQIDGGYRLKTLRTTGDGLLPTLAVAQSTAEALTAAEIDLPSFTSNANAEDVRRDILAQHQTVNLQALLAWAWEHGIIVAHLKLPKKMKPFAGVALILDDRPVIPLASRYDSPAWLVFHLAHEIAHILLGHVVPDEPSWDEEVGLSPTSPDEIEANKFALTVLTGRPEPEMRPAYGLTGPQLAAQLQTMEPYTRIDAGTAALIYGYSADRMGVAQKALKQLGLDNGGQAIIDRFLQEHLPEHVPASLTPILQLTGISTTSPHVCLSAIN